MPLAVLPDGVLAIQQYLQGIPEVTALIAPGSIVTTLPSAPVYPFVIVQWLGGLGHWPAMDETAIQIDVIGGTKFACGLLARTVRAAIWAISNDIVPEGILASGHEEVAPGWLPDTISIPPLPRYTARYRVLMHANANTDPYPGSTTYPSLTTFP
jgi:hypothetical protein